MRPDGFSVVTIFPSCSLTTSSTPFQVTSKDVGTVCSITAGNSDVRMLALHPPTNKIMLRMVQEKILLANNLGCLYINLIIPTSYPDSYFGSSFFSSYLLRHSDHSRPSEDILEQKDRPYFPVLS